MSKAISRGLPLKNHFLKHTNGVFADLCIVISCLNHAIVPNKKKLCNWMRFVLNSLLWLFYFNLMGLNFVFKTFISFFVRIDNFVEYH